MPLHQAETDPLTYYMVMGRAAAAISLMGEHREGDACVARASVSGGVLAKGSQQGSGHAA